MQKKVEMTTITINNFPLHLKKDIKGFCVDQDISIKDFVVETLKKELKKRKENEQSN